MVETVRGPGEWLHENGEGQLVVMSEPQNPELDAAMQSAPPKHTCGDTGPNLNKPWFCCGICDAKGCKVCEGS